MATRIQHQPIVTQVTSWVSKTSTWKRYIRHSGQPAATSTLTRLFSTDDDNIENNMIPSMHQKSYSLTGSSSKPALPNKNKQRPPKSCGPGVMVETNTGHQLQTDVPKSMGGSDLAPQPVETLLTALIGCTQATAIFVGRQMKPQRLVIEKMEFEITAVRDQRGALDLPIEETPTIPSRLQEISGTVRIFGSMSEESPLSEENLHILREQTEARCPIANMILASGCTMNVDWVDGNAASKPSTD